MRHAVLDCRDLPYSIQHLWSSYTNPVCPGKGSDFQQCHVASLPLFLPLTSISIGKLILPCDGGKLAEAAAELKSANPPNGSVDPPRNRRSQMLLEGCTKIHCNNRKWADEGKLFCVGQDGFTDSALSWHCFSCSPSYCNYTSLSNNQLDYFWLCCRACNCVFLGKD